MQAWRSRLFSEDLINLKRDVGELQILLDWQAESKLPIVALRDGSLELYHEPRQGEAFAREFTEYKELLQDLAKRNYILAGYIDRSRATLVTKMLDVYSTQKNKTNTPAGLDSLPDVVLMEKYLSPGRRSAIFELHSSSSGHYTGQLRVHFFYLNVGRPEKPYIVRVEIPAWVMKDKQKINLLQQVLLDQCRIMGSRPYPYLLHRAHEEAVVHYDEKEQLQHTLSAQLQQEGLGISQPSNKLSAKELQNRTRI